MQTNKRMSVLLPGATIYEQDDAALPDGRAIGRSQTQMLDSVVSTGSLQRVRFGDQV